MTSAPNGWELRVCPLDLSHLNWPYSMNWIDDNYLNLLASNHIYLPSSQSLTHDSFRDPSQSQKLLRSHPGGNETPVKGQADSPHQVDGNGRWHRSQGWDHEENLDIGFGWHSMAIWRWVDSLKVANFWRLDFRLFFQQPAACRMSFSNLPLVTLMVCSKKLDPAFCTVTPSLAISYRCKKM